MDFQTAIKESNEIIIDLDAQTAAERIEYMLGSTESARGFFVALLTSDSSAADEPPIKLAEALKRLNDDAQIVLVKNLVMSSATAVLHRRNGDAENAAGSDRVAERSANLIKLANQTALWNKLKDMRDSMDGKSEVFEKFFYRLGYDDEQISAARSRIDTTLKSRG